MLFFKGVIINKVKKKKSTIHILLKIHVRIYHIYIYIYIILLRTIQSVLHGLRTILTICI